MSVAVLGGGAFGLAVAIALSQDGTGVALWTRDRDDAERMRTTRLSGRKLPGHDLPPSLTVAGEIPAADVTLLALPAQSVRAFLEANREYLAESVLVSCAKGIERGSGLGPVDVIRSVLPGATAGCLTGPSFAVDIARGLPTALVLALEAQASDIQSVLTRPTFRVYRTSDVAGAQLGGALKNVIAIAAGIAIGAGLGDSARASVIARGFAEMSRYARSRGAEAETLQGLSGLGDLVLTCTSEKSRNFAAGLLIGRGKPLDPGVTVEGVATAQALIADAEDRDLDLPLTEAVAAVTDGRLDIETAIETLLSRPPGKE